MLVILQVLLLSSFFIFLNIIFSECVSRILNFFLYSFVAIVTGSTSGLRLENFLSDEQKVLLFYV